MPVHGTMRRALALLLITAVTATHTLTAAAQSSDGLPDPPEELQALAFLVGGWDVAGTLTMEDGETLEISGVSQIAWHMQDHLIREEWAATSGNTLIEGTNARGVTYNRRSNTWHMAWADSYSTGLKALVMQPQGTDTIYATSRGVGSVWEIVLDAIDDDSFHLTMRVAEGIGRDYAPRWDLTYSRRDEAPEDTAAALDAVRESGEALPRAERADDFAFWIGSWDVLSQTITAGQVIEAPGHDTVSWAIGQHAFEEYWDGRQLPRPFLAYSLSRWNTEESVWDNVWWSTGTTNGFQVFRGDGCDEDDGKTYCTLAGSFTDITEETFYWQIPREREAGRDSANWVLYFTRVEATE